MPELKNPSLTLHTYSIDSKLIHLNYVGINFVLNYAKHHNITLAKQTTE